VFIVAGKHDLTNFEVGEQRIVVGQILIHPQWNPFNYANDMCLLFLETPLQFNK
jgi:hypothetical protein